MGPTKSKVQVTSLVYGTTPLLNSEFATGPISLIMLDHFVTCARYQLGPQQCMAAWSRIKGSSIGPSMACQSSS